MLRRILAASIALVAAAMAAAPLAADPLYGGVFVARVGSGSTDIALERVQPTSKFKIKALGLGGGASTTLVAGEHSPVRFRRDVGLSLIVRLADASVDPQSAVRIVRAKVSKGNRILGVISGGIFGGGEKPVDTASFEAQPYKGAMARLTISPATPAGEYCALASATTLSAAPPAFCFGLD